MGNPSAVAICFAVRASGCPASHTRIESALRTERMRVGARAAGFIM